MFPAAPTGRHYAAGRGSCGANAVSTARPSSRSSSLPTGKGGMFEKGRNVTCGLADAGTHSTGSAAKRPTLTEASPAHLPDRARGAPTWRERRHAARPPHCTDARHVTVRPHYLQVCLARVDRAPPGFAHGRDRPWRALARLPSGRERRRRAPGGRQAMGGEGVRAAAQARRARPPARAGRHLRRRTTASGRSGRLRGRRAGPAVRGLPNQTAGINPRQRNRSGSGTFPAYRPDCAR